MSNINCDIIKDLLGSYFDGVCSDSTKELVEEHLKGCEVCQRFVVEMRAEDEKGNLENQQIHGLKKINSYVNEMRSIIAFLITVIVSVVFILIVQNDFGDFRNYYMIIMNILFVVLVVCYSNIFRKKSGRNASFRGNVLLKCLSFANLLHIVLLEIMVVYWAYTGNYPRIIPAESLGAFVTYNIRVNVIFGGCMLLVHYGRYRRNAEIHYLLQDIIWLGIGMDFSFLEILGQLISVSGLVKRICVSELILVVEIAVLFIVQGRRDRLEAKGIDYKSIQKISQ